MQKGILLLIICLGFIVPIQAQDTTRISLNDAIDIALENNYQLKQARNNLDLAETREFSEKADFFPSLSSSVNQSTRIGRQFNDNTGEFGNFTIRGVGAGLNVNVPIFSGFENVSSLKSTRFGKQSQEENLEWTRENIIFNAARSYLEVLLNEELLRIEEENLAASQKTLKQVKAQVDVGSRPSVDLYNQEATVANNELNVTNQQNALRLSKIQLIRQLQVDPSKNYSFVTPEINAGQLVMEEYSLDELVQTALSNRSDLRREELNVRSLQEDLRIANWSLYPTIGFSASLSSSYNDRTTRIVRDQNGNPLPDPKDPTLPLTEKVPFQDQFFDRNISRSFGFSMSIPIFNNWNRRTNRASTKINYKNAVLSLENTELQVVQEVNQAYNDYVSYRQQLESTLKALQAAQKTYEIQLQRYNVGASTLIELSDANAQYVRAQANRERAVYNFIFQKKLLDFYIGKLNREISLNQ